MLNIAVKAARAAGQVIVRHVGRIDTLTITNKRPNDFVTEVDRMAEAEIIRVLQRAYPDHAFMAEESGIHGDNREYVWIIDPLDGTTNFLHDLSHFAVSIALRYRDRIDQAVVYDPVREELFTASRGGGAMLNNRRIRVSPRKELQAALLGTGIPFRADQDLEYYLKTLGALLPETAGVRRCGCAALDLAYVAAGRLDGFWEMGLREWDMAAGVLLVQEAGGLVGDLQGGEHHFKTGNVVAANPKLFKAMLQRLHSVS